MPGTHLLAQGRGTAVPDELPSNGCGSGPSRSARVDLPESICPSRSASVDRCDGEGVLGKSARSRALAEHPVERCLVPGSSGLAATLEAGSVR